MFYNYKDSPKLKKIETTLFNLGINFRLINVVISNAKNKSDENVLSELKTIFENVIDVDSSAMEIIKTYLIAYNELQRLKVDVTNNEPIISSSPIKKQ